ncbi:hypothetical protein BDP55DRAFT_317693 [Colletotrichum godetiae]|uniref:Uncharacterized protein n=1 Tax=Colletotrichum godetiae TaxID=1209918 RepID=A0AAJ0AVF1_9PEZI|nr:uncharacterized protein BDP55DRAFT_317693 [Colletotrichum godetiae]KAK1691101.1 hypothetical protein BDP55DRAFT_317693 [Colletotrichum godetiae]
MRLLRLDDSSKKQNDIGMYICFASGQCVLGSDMSEVAVPGRAILQAAQAPDTRNAKAPSPFSPFPWLNIDNVAATCCLAADVTRRPREFLAHY